MKPQLFEYELQEGQRLLDAFDKASVHIDTALWLYEEERESWHLVLGTPLCDDEGSLVIYQILLDVFRSVKPELRIEWTYLKVVGLNDTIIQALTYTQDTYNPKYKNVHVPGAYLEYLDEQQDKRQVCIDEAYIYFVNKPHQYILNKVLNVFS
jgi:hypothetical protein